MIKPMSQRYPAEDVEITIDNPERRMWAAALERCIRDVASQGEDNYSDQQKICRQAIAWMRNVSHEIGSFKWVCEVLDLDPRLVRRMIYEVKTSQKRWDVYDARFDRYDTCGVKRKAIPRLGLEPKIY